MPSAAEAAGRAPVSWLIATFCGVGHFPFASGTVATLAAVPVYLAGWYAGGDAAVAALALFFAVSGMPAASALEKTLGYHDPSEVVVDEVAGFLFTMAFLPLTVWTLAAGFFIFRALDVLKPWPASRAEKLPGGWGIMADDLVCGVMGNLIIHAGLWAGGWLWR